MRATELLAEAVYAELTGRDGLPQRVWKNPGAAEFRKVIKGADSHDGMRSVLTERDLYFWQSTALLHDDFLRQTGLEGVKISLRSDTVLANLETVGLADHFPWVFAATDPATLDMDERQASIEAWLRSNRRLQRAYGSPDFPIIWYS